MTERNDVPSGPDGDDELAREVYAAMAPDADPDDPMVQDVREAMAKGYIITTETE